MIDWLFLNISFFFDFLLEENVEAFPKLLLYRFLYILILVSNLIKLKKKNPSLG